MANQSSDMDFYREHYHHVILGLMGLMVLMMVVTGFIFYQALNRPQPVFTARQADGQTKILYAYSEPNLLPDTILRWAGKAAISAYTFDFVNYQAQLSDVEKYFTKSGWQGYIRSVGGLIDDIVTNKLIVNGIVAGTPVIANEGPLPGKGYSWRVQIPFLVTYQTGGPLRKRQFTVVLTIVRVPTDVYPQGIGIDQFLMV